jgi:hypothetical protein
MSQSPCKAAIHGANSGVTPLYKAFGPKKASKNVINHYRRPNSDRGLNLLVKKEFSKPPNRHGGAIQAGMQSRPAAFEPPAPNPASDSFG